MKNKDETMNAETIVNQNEERVDAQNIGAIESELSIAEQDLKSRMEEKFYSRDASIFEQAEALGVEYGKRLWRPSSSFDEYCRVRHGLSLRQSMDLVGLYSLCKELYPKGNRPEWVTLELLRPMFILPPMKRKPAWLRILERAGDKLPSPKDVHAEVMRQHERKNSYEDMCRHGSRIKKLVRRVRRRIRTNQLDEVEELLSEIEERLHRLV